MDMQLRSQATFYGKSFAESLQQQQEGTFRALDPGETTLT